MQAAGACQQALWDLPRCSSWGPWAAMSACLIMGNTSSCTDACMGDSMLANAPPGCIWRCSCTSHACQQVHELGARCGCRWQSGQWGYACCHQTTKNSYCTGEAGQLAQQAQAEQMQANVERKAQEDAEKAENTPLEVRIRAVSSLQASCQALPRLRASAGPSA